MIGTLRVNEARMEEALDDAMLATDLADYLSSQGVPFRQSHHLVGRAVKRAEDLGVSLKELGLQDYQAIHPAFGSDLYSVFDFSRSISRRSAEGGTAPAAVGAQIKKAWKFLPIG